MCHSPFLDLHLLIMPLGIADSELNTVTKAKNVRHPKNAATAW